MKHTSAFTLIELLMVVMIIAIILTVGITSISAAKKEADSQVSKINHVETPEAPWSTPVANPDNSAIVTITKTFLKGNIYFIGTDKGLFTIGRGLASEIQHAKLFSELIPEHKYAITYIFDPDVNLPAIKSAVPYGKFKPEDE